jgi:hypothetical protein
MDRTQILLKFKQIAIDNFTNISEDSPIVPLVVLGLSLDPIKNSRGERSRTPVCGT